MVGLEVAIFDRLLVHEDRFSPACGGSIRSARAKLAGGHKAAE